MILGIDIGGTKCAVVLGQSDGHIVARVQEPTRAADGPDSILARIAATGAAILAKAGLAPADLEGVGVSCGGPLDRVTGVVHSPPNLPGWDAVPVRDYFEQAFPGARIELDNDANATAMAEWRHGAGQGTRDMAFVTMGTGIGAGLVLDGSLYRGANNLAGEVGHQTIMIDGPRCGCGKRGCLEALASGPAIARQAREGLRYGRGKTIITLAGGDPASITGEHVVEAAKRGDALALRVLTAAGFYMGVGLANLIQIVNPECIVLGTVAVHAGDLILEPIRRAVMEHAWERSRAVCRILPAALGDRAQDLAALSLVG